jgi:hypothetical protein
MMDMDAFDAVRLDPPIIKEGKRLHIIMSEPEEYLSVTKGKKYKVNRVFFSTAWGKGYQFTNDDGIAMNTHELNVFAKRVTKEVWE